MAAQVAAWDEVGDGRAIFLDCYRRMTGAVVDNVGRGRFDDGVWVETLLDRFAGYYFSTIDDDTHDVYVPEPWLLAHGAAMSGDGQPIQLLLSRASTPTSTTTWSAPSLTCSTTSGPPTTRPAERGAVATTT
ncbi:MAG: DUF5995 family protein [Ilumatobacteraceae bacterium]